MHAIVCGICNFNSGSNNSCRTGPRPHLYTYGHLLKLYSILEIELSPAQLKQLIDTESHRIFTPHAATVTLERAFEIASISRGEYYLLPQSSFKHAELLVF